WVNRVVLQDLVLLSGFVDSEQNSVADRANQSGIAVKLAVRSLDEPVRSAPVRVGFRFSSGKLIQRRECARRDQRKYQPARRTIERLAGPLSRAIDIPIRPL